MMTLHEDIFDIAERAVNAAFEGKAVVIAVFYERACELIREILSYESTKICDIDLNEPDWENYYDEFLITLALEDGEVGLYCDKAKNMDKDIYLRFEADLLFLESDAHFRIVEANELEDAEVYEVDFDGEYEDDDEYDEDDEYEEDEEEEEDGDYSCEGDVHLSLTSPDGETISADMPLEQFLGLLLLSELV